MPCPLFVPVVEEGWTEGEVTELIEERYLSAIREKDIEHPGAGRAGARTWRSPRTGAEYPVQWRVRVGDRLFEVEPLLDDAELDSRSSTGTIYWEGPVTLRTAEVKRAGLGYLELTGYGGAGPDF